MENQKKRESSALDILTGRNVWLDEVSNWDEILSQSTAHCVCDRMVNVLKHYPRSVPVEKFQQNMEMHRVKSAVHSVLIEKLDIELHKRGIEAMWFKGTAMDSWLNGVENTCRPSSDIDLIVRPESDLEARLALENFGFFPISDDPQGGHSSWVGPYGKLVELHWGIDWGDSVRPLQAEDVKRVDQIKLNNHVITVPNAELMLVLACVHGTRHEWGRMRWLIDVHDIIRQKDITWDEVINIAKRYRSVKKVMWGVGLARKLFRSPAPKSFKIPASLIQDSLKIIENFQEVCPSHEIDPVRTLHHAFKTSDGIVGYLTTIKTTLRKIFIPADVDIENANQSKSRIIRLLKTHFIEKHG